MKTTQQITLTCAYYGHDWEMFEYTTGCGMRGAALVRKCSRCGLKEGIGDE